MRSIGAVGLGAVAGGHHGVEQLLGRIACDGTIFVVQVVVGFEHHRHGMVTNHAVGFVAGQFPHGQLAPLLEVFHGGVDEVDGAFGLNLSEQRVQGAVGVPEGEDGVDLAALVDHVDLSVSATIAAVLVAPEVRGRHTMVEGGIEAALLLLASTVHTQLAEGFFPGLVGRLTGTLEVLVLGGNQVADGTVDIHPADSHLELHLLGGGQLHPCLRRVVAHHHAHEGHVGLNGEIEMLVGIPC